MTVTGWAYPDDIRQQLARHGLAPTAATPPARVREALSDLYRYEIRRLRRRLLDGQVEKPRYVGEVIALRKKYWLLSLTPAAWDDICRPGVTASRRSLP
jgi:hypothetical protein